MNIVLVTRFYPPDTGGGGIAAYARYAAQGLIQAGHHVQIVSMQAEHSIPFQIVDGIPVYRLPSPLKSYRWTKIPFIGSHIRFLRDWIYSLQVRFFLLKHQKEFKPDVVEYADIDAEGLNHPSRLCPFVIKLHTSHVILKNYYTRPKISYSIKGIEWIEANTIKKAQGISSPSNFLADQISEKLDIARDRIKYVTNLIDSADYVPQQENRSVAIKEILYVGRLEPLKGAVVFSEAIPLILERHPNLHFTLAGADRSGQDGSSQKKALEEYFMNNDCLDRVTFIGHADPKVYKQLYQRADVFVLPSLFENSPYTLLEAMSCGCACVVHRCSGMAEMVEDGKSGIFFENADPQGLADKVVELLQNPELRARLGQNARSRILENYSLTVGANQAIEFYQSVIAESK